MIFLLVKLWINVKTDSGQCKIVILYNCYHIRWQVWYSLLSFYTCILYIGHFMPVNNYFMLSFCARKKNKVPNCCYILSSFLVTAVFFNCYLIKQDAKNFHEIFKMSWLLKLNISNISWLCFYPDYPKKKNKKVNKWICQFYCVGTRLQHAGTTI